MNVKCLGEETNWCKGEALGEVLVGGVLSRSITSNLPRERGVSGV